MTGSDNPAHKADISTLSSGSYIKGAFFIIHEVTTQSKKTGDIFLRFILGDGNKRIKAVMWDNVSHISPALRTGDIIKVQGTVGTWQNERQITIRKLRKAEHHECPPQEFNPMVCKTKILNGCCRR